MAEKDCGSGYHALRAVALLTVASTLIAGMGAYWFRVQPLDFLTYRYAGQQAFAGNAIYDGNISGPGLPGQPFTYTPFAALLFRGFSVLDWRLSYVIWSIGSLVGLGLVIYSLLPALNRLTWTTVGFVMACCTTVVFANVANGQVNILLLVLCLLDLYGLQVYRGRRTGGRWVRHLGGVGVGLAAAIKLTPALFIVHLAVTRQWKALGTSVATAALASGIAFVVFPQLSRDFFGSAVWHLQERVRLDHPLGYWGNASLSGALHAWGGWSAFIVPVAVVAVAVYALACARVAHVRGHMLNALLIVGLAAPVVSPFAWVHHYIYLVPAVVVIARSLIGLDERSFRRGAGWIGLVWLLLALGPGSGHWLLVHGDEWLRPLALVIREGPLLATGLCVSLLLRHSPAVQPSRVVLGPDLDRADPVAHPSRTPSRTPSRAT